MNITISETIKRLRTEKSVTQESLAAFLGVTPQAISRWESGAGYPAIEYLPQMARYFDVSVDELLGVKLSEREEKRKEIYQLIAHIEECGYNTTALGLMRDAHAEFPRDEMISLSLAKTLYSTMLDDEPDKSLIQEAEKIIRDLIRKTDNHDFRFACIKELATLYREAWKDEHGYLDFAGKGPANIFDTCLCRQRTNKTLGACFWRAYYPPETCTAKYTDIKRRGLPCSPSFNLSTYPILASRSGLSQNTFPPCSAASSSMILRKHSGSKNCFSRFFERRPAPL